MYEDADVRKMEIAEEELFYRRTSASSVEMRWKHVSSGLCVSQSLLADIDPLLFSWGSVRVKIRVELKCGRINVCR